MPNKTDKVKEEVKEGAKKVAEGAKNAAVGAKNILLVPVDLAKKGVNKASTAIANHTK